MEPSDFMLKTDSSRESSVTLAAGATVEVMTLTGAITRREAIHISLEAFVKRAARQKILRHRAAGTWAENLAQLREDKR